MEPAETDVEVLNLDAIRAVDLEARLELAAAGGSTGGTGCSTVVACDPIGCLCDADYSWKC